MKAKAIIRASNKIKNDTKASVYIRLTGLGKHPDGTSYQINQMASTPIETYAKYWNSKEGKNNLVTPKTGKGRPVIGNVVLEETERLNAELLLINEKINSACQYVGKQVILIPNDQISIGWLKLTLDKYFNPQNYGLTEKRPTTLFEYIEEFIKKVPTRKDTKTGRIVSKDVGVKYQNSFDKLKEFAVYDRKPDYSFDSLDIDFYDRYINFLQARGYTTNTVGRFVKELKAILSQATREGINKSNAYKDFIVLREDIDNVFLTESELMKIKNADLNKSPKEIKQILEEQAKKFDMELEEVDYTDNWRVYQSSLDKVRSFFLLLAWTGCRFSDLEKIQSQDINDKFLTFRQQKTNTKVVIPIHPVVKEIFEKYDYTIASPISNQKFNDYIKIVCMLAGIDSPSSITRTEGGIRKTSTYPKWKLVSSHTGRRCFCTNQYLRGLPVLMIMKISGHKSEKSFLKYIKVSEEEHARMMAEKWAEMYQ